MDDGVLDDVASADDRLTPGAAGDDEDRPERY
jgi:hypothetical protein